MKRAQIPFAAAAVTALFAGFAGPAYAADPPHLKPSEAGQPLTPSGSLGFSGPQIKKLRRSASGIACLSPGRCLIVFDEGREARTVALTPTSFAPGDVVELATSGEELDAEAATVAGGDYVVTGSHAMKRGDCDANLASRFVARVRVDPATGATSVTQGSILPAIDRTPVLKAALGHCLDKGGLDIEGVAAIDGRLWFGLRGPKSGSGDYVLRVVAEAVFSAGDLAPALETVDVGPGRAIRDMQPIGEQLMILAGPEGGANSAVPYALAIWTPGSAKPADILATLDLSGLKRREDDACKDEKLDDVKPEGVMIVDPKAATLKVAVISDGLCDGGPLWFDVER